MKARFPPGVYQIFVTSNFGGKENKCFVLNEDGHIRVVEVGTAPPGQFRIEYDECGAILISTMDGKYLGKGKTGSGLVGLKWPLIFKSSNKEGATRFELSTRSPDNDNIISLREVNHSDTFMHVSDTHKNYAWLATDNGFDTYDLVDNACVLRFDRVSVP